MLGNNRNISPGEVTIDFEHFTMTSFYEQKYWVRNEKLQEAHLQHKH